MGTFIIEDILIFPDQKNKQSRNCHHDQVFHYGPAIKGSSQEDSKTTTIRDIQSSQVSYWGNTRKNNMQS